MTIDDIRHCLLVMIDCEVCEECNLYGTTGTDHCEPDCVDGALHIIDKYQKIEDIYYHQTGEALENSLRAVIEGSEG